MKSTHQVLGGPWRLATDAENRGRERRWAKTVPAQAKDAPVPGVIQQVFPNYHGVAWYWLKFKLLAVPESGERALLRFGAVDYLAEVWLNGQPVGGHEGGETPFTLNATDALQAGENLLAVRVLNCTDEPVDGIRLAETPHSQKGNSGVGANFNPGGIVLPVELELAPTVRIADVFAAPKIHSGKIQARVTLMNVSGSPVRGNLRMAAGGDKAGDVVARDERIILIGTGETTHEIDLVVPQPHLWELNDPYLYRVTAALGTDERSVRCGFRELRVERGFFFLNGARIFLRSCHTFPTFPIAQTAPDPELMRRDLVYAKSCGFNCVRFLSKMPLPEQLDLCDEIGLLIYEESYAGWWSLKDADITDRDAVARRFRSAIAGMVRRDRNHPCVAIWGLLNEVNEGFIFRQAAASLPLIRELDDTRLVLLGSGRWDKDSTLGSVCNPGSRRWEPQWGAEGAKAARSEKPVPPGPGDVHYYPQTPLSEEACDFLRTLGESTKPVFLSEGGIGSLMNPIGEARKFDEKPGLREDLEDRAFLNSLAGRWERDWKRFDLQAAHPFPEDLLRESQRVHIAQRRRWFDLVRANSNLCGHSLTSMGDYGTSGEGCWTHWREMKPGIADALRDGWAPLRWCLFVDPLHGYTGRPIRLRAVLANEDVLRAGEYPVTFRIWSRQGLAWEKRVTMNLPARGKGGLPPLAVPVLDQTVRLKEAGEYTFAACLERGGVPAGDRRQFHVTAAPVSIGPKIALTVWGLEPRVQRLLKRCGAKLRPFRKGDRPERETILVGAPQDLGPENWQNLFRRIACGAYAAFLEPELFSNSCCLPLKKKGRFVRSRDWLYHKESVAKAHPIFDGLPAPGILDWDYYDEVAGRHLFFDADDPDETIVAGVATGLTPFGVHPDRISYACAPMVGEYRFGAGRFLVSGLCVLPQVDRHPAAGRLLLNIARHAANRARKRLTRVPAGIEKKVQALCPASRAAVPERDGSVPLLPAQAALLASTGGVPASVLSNPDGTDRIGCWSNPRALAVWSMRLPKAGRYRVTVEQASDEGGAGRTYTLRLGKAVLKGCVRPTPKGWFDYVDVDLGAASIPAGSVRVELSPTAGQGGEIFMDVKRIRLVPDET